MSLMRLGWILYLMTPTAVLAQGPSGDLETAVDSLLSTSQVDRLLNGLPGDFVARFLRFAPDLPEADRAALDEVAREAFDPGLIRAHLVTSLAESADPEHVSQLLESRHSGVMANWAMAAGPTPAPDQLDDYLSSLTTEDLGQLQSLASLVELQGTARLGLEIEQALGRAAADVIAGLGGSVSSEQMDADAYDAAYRQAVLRIASEQSFIYRNAPDSLVAAVAAAYQSEAGRWLVESYEEAVLDALETGAMRLLELTRATSVDETPAAGASAGLPCRVQACGYVFDWQGRVPTDYNQRFGRAGDLEALVLDRLVRAGYQLRQGIVEGGLTLRLTARTTYGLCQAVSGTGNTRCTAIDGVLVDFLGAHPDYETPTRVNVRNRCGADGLLNASGFSALVAARLHYELTRLPGDDREVPRC